MTIRSTMDRIRALGLVVSYTEDGEFAINYPGGSFATVERTSNEVQAIRIAVRIKNRYNSFYNANKRKRQRGEL